MFIFIGISCSFKIVFLEIAFLQVKSAKHVIALGTETLSTRVFEGHRVLREDILVTRNSLESSLMAQREQLSRIETRSKTHQSRLDNVEQLLKDLCIISSLPGNQGRSKVCSPWVITKMQVDD